jgi:uncharacterized membrane protein YfcA
MNYERGAMSQDFSAILWMGEIALAALGGGVIGAISGLGGGIVLVPILTLLMGIPIQQAVAVSLVSVIAVSSGAGSVYVRDHMVNIRIAMFLEIFTVGGALLAAGLIATHISPQVLSILFGATMLLSLIPIFLHMGDELPQNVQSSPIAAWLRLSGSYHDNRLGKEVDYNVASVWPAAVLMFLAGVISALLGIGAGVVKVLAHELVMKIPTKVSTATSNFMIGVTAAAGAGIYLKRGVVLPFVAAPVAVAVLIGAIIGTKLMQRMSNVRIRQVFAACMGIIGLEMLSRGLGVGF